MQDSLCPCTTALRPHSRPRCVKGDVRNANTHFQSRKKLVYRIYLSGFKRFQEEKLCKQKESQEWNRMLIIETSRKERWKLFPFRSDVIRMYHHKQPQHRLPALLWEMAEPGSACQWPQLGNRAGKAVACGEELSYPSGYPRSVSCDGKAANTVQIVTTAIHGTEIVGNGDRETL